MTKEADEVLGLYFPVLNHGFVALVDYMGDDAAVVQAARVSYGAGTKTVNEDRGTLRYMMRHNHTSPFEMVELKFHVKLPIFVARQLIRHRTANVNEYSLRYSLPAMQFYVPEPEHMGTQSKKNKQGRAAPVDERDAAIINAAWHDLQLKCAQLYEYMVGSEVDLARELARMHLPLSLYTEWYWKIDLHNCLHFLKLRCDKHAQWEIQQVARLKAALCKLVAPTAFEAWIDYSFQARTFSRMEMQVLQDLLELKEDALLTRGGSFYAGSIKERHGLSDRELSEFLNEFSQDSHSRYMPEEFSLDMSKAMPASFFLEQAKLYLPKSL